MWANVLMSTIAVVAAVFAVDECRVKWIKRRAMKRLESRLDEAERRLGDR